MAEIDIASQTYTDNSGQTRSAKTGQVITPGSISAPAGTGQSYGFPNIPAPASANTTPSTTITQVPNTQQTGGLDVSLFSGSSNPYLASEASLSARTAELQAAESARIEATKAGIRNKFNELRATATQQGNENIASRESTLGRVGSSQRFSSAAIGFIDSAKEQMAKNIRDLDSQEAQAIANLDVELADKIRELKQNEYDRIDKINEQRFSQIMDVMNYNLNLQKTQYGLLQDATAFAFDSTIKKSQLDLDTISALSKIPSGQSVEINGKVYEGIGSNGDLKFYQETVIENGVRKSKVFSVDTSGNVVNSATLGTVPSPSSGSSTIRSTAGSSLSTRVGQEYANIMKGLYGRGVEGREQGISVLQAEFPGTDVRSMIENRIPDSIIPKIADKNFTASTAPEDIINLASEDIRSGDFSLDQLIEAYPELSPTLIQDLYYNL